MHLWDYPKTQAPTDDVWRLERLLTYGLGGEKISRALLEKYLPQLRIPDNTRAFLELLLWDRRF